MKHEIEIFTSGCYLCREAVEIVEKAKCSECTLTEYNLAENANLRYALPGQKNTASKPRRPS